MKGDCLADLSAVKDRGEAVVWWSWLMSLGFKDWRSTSPESLSEWKGIAVNWPIFLVNKSQRMDMRTIFEENEKVETTRLFLVRSLKSST